MLRVSQFANTIIGKPGNIGVRTERIIRVLSNQGEKGYCLSRASHLRSSFFFYRDMGWLGHIPRALKAINIYAYPFNFRYPAIKLFEWFALRHVQEAVYRAPDVAHVWDVCPSLMKSLKSAGYPIVLDVSIAPGDYALRISKTYGSDILKTNQSVIDLEHNSFELADILLAPSKFVAEELLLIGVEADKIRVIEFGVDLSLNASISSQTKNKTMIDYAFVGNVNLRKGVDLLLTAWNNKAFKDDRLHLCGRVFPEIKQYISDKCRGTILTPGFINPFEYLKQCDVFVFPSWLEGSAKAVYEAMACGLPVIVTHSSGSVVRDGIDGFVIDPGDMDSLRDRMMWFKNNPEQIKIMGDAAKERVKEFTWERYADRVIDVYKELSH